MAKFDAVYFDKSKKTIERRTVFIVEGLDDAFFLDKILAEASANSADVGTTSLDGKDNLEARLSLFLRGSPVTRGITKNYALVLDADTDAQATARNAQALLRKLGQPCPSHGNIDGEDVKVGLFVLPSGNDDGNLEKLLLSTIGNDQKFIAVRKFFDDIQATFSLLDEPDKRLSRIYLDCSPGHHRGAGRAFSSGSFDASHSVLQPFKDFVLRMVQK